jgi:hypothetical protein
VEERWESKRSLPIILKQTKHRIGRCCRRNEPLRPGVSRMSNRRHALVHADVGFSSTRYGNIAIPLLLVTVDIPAALDDLPFSFGGMFGFTQFRASSRGDGPVRITATW